MFARLEHSFVEQVKVLGSKETVGKWILIIWYQTSCWGSNFQYKVNSFPFFHYFRSSSTFNFLNFSFMGFLTSTYYVGLEEQQDHSNFFFLVTCMSFLLLPIKCISLRRLLCPTLTWSLKEQVMKIEKIKLGDTDKE